MNTFFSFLLFFFLTLKSYGQLTFTNSSKEELYISIGYFVGTNWYSEGWWRLNKGETKTLFSQTLTNRFYYYRAVGKTLTWEGSDYFYIDPVNAFKIQQNKLPTTVSNLKYEKFKLIDVANFKSYTITLTSDNDFPMERIQHERPEHWHRD